MGGGGDGKFLGKMINGKKPSLLESSLWIIFTRSVSSAIKLGFVTNLSRDTQRWEFIKENNKVRKQELDQESDQENKKVFSFFLVAF